MASRCVIKRHTLMAIIFITKESLQTTSTVGGTALWVIQRRLFDQHCKDFPLKPRPGHTHAIAAAEPGESHRFCLYADDNI